MYLFVCNLQILQKLLFPLRRKVKILPWKLSGLDLFPFEENKPQCLQNRNLFKFSFSESIALKVKDG